MLESKISGVKINMISTSLPTEKILVNNNTSHYIAGELQTSADLGYDAAERIISNQSIGKEDIGILLFGSKTPDYRSPNTAAILQGRLGLSVDCICFDTNVGANGFIQMTQVAAAILAKSTSKYALVVIGDTPSKLQDRAAGINFELSDAATAILLEKSSDHDVLEFFTYSSGDHYKGSSLKKGGFRNFNENTPYDGSKSENYIVNSESRDLQDFFEDVRPLIDDFLKDKETAHFLNSFALDHLHLNDHWKNERSIKADASELPLLLENAIKQELLQSNNLHLISAGEGMALMGMKITYVPEILPVNYTLDYFKDYKISHEM
ncbi:hypothetical protein [Kaistella sp.]|uniref:hypothetical protein n=1 Tax=Kaistella sp. TaxID=2782235 RepID=UPI003C3FB47B